MFSEAKILDVLKSIVFTLCTLYTHCPYLNISNYFIHRKKIIFSDINFITKTQKKGLNNYKKKNAKKKTKI